MSDPEVSVVMPCLNEADTIEICVGKALKALAEAHIPGEVVVADNGSTDGSQDLAKTLGARVIAVPEKGYGNALMAGIEAAKGTFVIMGDADDSYDFLEIPKFVEKLRQGYDLVMGCRLPSGCGRIAPGAMPWLHRWLGNPMFSKMGRVMFKSPVHDVYCGLRGFTKEHYTGLKLHCTGMEFAIEMIVKSSLFQARITEVPITLHPDGRKAHAPHLKTFRDGWRTLRFFMLFSPRWLYLVPGVSFIFLGLILAGMAMLGVQVGRAQLDVHTLLYSCLAVIIGYQSILFNLMTKVFAIGSGLLPPEASLSRFFRFATLEKGLILSGLLFSCGIALLGLAIGQWLSADFGRLDYPKTMRIIIPGMTMTAIGFQTFLSSCFVSILGLKRK